MVSVSDDEVRLFQERVLSWYVQHKRFLPWRLTRNPYHILVSEVMSQQTQIGRVIAYYDEWLRHLPDVYALATCDTKKLLSLWSGLGYNSRALRLRELAGVVVREYGGFIPDDYDELIKLPGIGDYTANALLAFAFGRDVPVVDTNIRRVLMSEFDLPSDCSLDEIKSLAFRCVPPGKSREWHNALMDYGSLVLTAKKTGIRPLSKQGRFEGSDREVRGFITKQLTLHDSVTFSSIKKVFPKKDVKGIIKKMVNDGIIRLVGYKILLA